MNSSRISCALCAWLILAALVHAQTMRIVSDGNASGGIELGKGPHTPFDRLDELQSWNSGFQNAGARKVGPSGSQSMLEYVLARSGEEWTGDNLELGKLFFRDRWLTRQLQQRFPDIESVDIVDHATSRTRGESSTTSVERRLEVVGTADAVQAAERFIDDVIRQNRQLVTLKIFILQRELAANGLTRNVRVATVDEAAFTALSSRFLSKQRKTNLLTAPVLTVFGGQSAYMTVMNQISYIRSYNTQKIGDGIIVDPIVDIINDGIVVQATPIIDDSGKEISLGISVGVSTLKLPMEEMEVEVPPDDVEITIQLPEVNLVDWSSEDLTLREREYGFHVSGLRLDEWSEDGDRLPTEMEVLIQAQITDPANVEQGRGLPFGIVLGFDSKNKLAFARLNSERAFRPDNETSVSIQRDGKIVGKGKLADILGNVAIIKLEDGEAQAADELIVR